MTSADEYDAQSVPQQDKKENPTSASYEYNHNTVDISRRVSLLGTKSPGVARVEALSRCLTTTDRVFIFSGLFLIAYAYGLDGTTRYTYQATATNSYATHSLLAAVNVIRSVVAAAAQPTAAKIADVFGRLEFVLVSVLFYVVGTVVEAVSTGVQTFAAGAVLYQIGYTGILFMAEVIIGDITSMKTRVVFSYIPALPFIINAWISGNVTQSVLTHSTWQWGIGMWAIIYPVCALPLILALWFSGLKARRSGELDNYLTPFRMLGPKRLLIDLFWQLDVIGIILLIAVFALILTPLTIAGGATAQWKTAHVIAPLVVGIICVPAFVVWEMRAQHPLVPFYLLKDRGVWAAIGIATFLNFAWYLQGDFLYTVLIVAFDFPILEATRLTNIYSFCSVVTGCVIGFVIVKVRRLKPFVVAGTCLFLVAFGLLIRFRGGANSSNKSGVIGAQVLLGIAGGLFPYPAQASIQAATQHEHLAAITALYLACYYVGSALGNCVSGAIWTQTLYPTLKTNLDSLNGTLADAIYKQPLSEVFYHPVGTPERTAIISSYQHVQRYLTITGICLCVPLIVFSLLLRNPRLSDEQSQPEAEEGHVVR